ncbi:TIM barrel protein [Candidatus Micrarchaeota archaeon]|nr:TIM barrel protein [Candidatus Micrarchaeota archaeon]MBU1166441.1 TIM barrel protein [Candidatus Micrarchaeota archaeon]
MSVRFGPAGIPIQCKGSSTIDGIACCADLGLGAMEMEFVHGVRMTDETAQKARMESEKSNVRLSSHAPYYVNFCSMEKQKVDNSIKHIFRSAQVTCLAGGDITVFHPGFYQKLSPEDAYKLAKANLLKLESELQNHGIKIRLGAETVGKKSAFGGLEENIRLANEVETIELVIDFAHIHARGDIKLTGEDDYLKLFEKLEKELDGYVNHFHSHFSEIEYTAKGERNHIPLGTSNEPPFNPLMKVLKQNGYSGTIICESPKLDLDALKMKQAYDKIHTSKISMVDGVAYN